MKKWKGLGRLALLALLGLALVSAVVPAWASSGRGATREFDIHASQFSYSPYVIRVNTGDHVRITLQANEDVAHGLYLDGYDVNLKSWKSKKDSVEFVADKPGKFRFRCSETCGPLHPFMIGEMIVAPNYTYQISLVLAVLTAVGTLAYRWRKERN